MLQANDSNILNMMRCDAGLGESLELRDLLAYLTDRVLHFPRCHFDNKNGRPVVPPMVTGEHAWHCTRQGGWLRSDISPPLTWT